MVIEMCIVVIISYVVNGGTCIIVDSLITKVKLTLKDDITFTFAIQTILDMTLTSYPGNYVKQMYFPWRII